MAQVPPQSLLFLPEQKGGSEGSRGDWGWACRARQTPTVSRTLGFLLRAEPEGHSPYPGREEEVGSASPGRKWRGSDSLGSKLLQSRGQCGGCALAWQAEISPASLGGQQPEAKLLLPPCHHPLGRRGQLAGEGSAGNTAPPSRPWALLGPSRHLPWCRPTWGRRPRVPSPGWSLAVVGPLLPLLVWVQAVTPAQGFPFKRKSEGTWKGPIVPRSRARSGNLEAAVIVQQGGKEGSFLFFYFLTLVFFFP